MRPIEVVLLATAIATAAPAVVAQPAHGLLVPATFVHTVGRVDMIENWLIEAFQAEIIEVVPIDWRGNPAYRARFVVQAPEHPEFGRERVLIFDAGSLMPGQIGPIAEQDPEPTS